MFKTCSPALSHFVYCCIAQVFRTVSSSLSFNDIIFRKVFFLLFIEYDQLTDPFKANYIDSILRFPAFEKSLVFVPKRIYTNHQKYQLLINFCHCSPKTKWSDNK